MLIQVRPVAGQLSPDQAPPSARNRQYLTRCQMNQPTRIRALQTFDKTPVYYTVAVETDK